MNMRLTSGLLMAAGMAIAATALPAVADVGVSVSLDEAMRQGLVDVEVKSLGGATGDKIRVDVRRKVDRKVEIEVTPGTVFRPSGGTVQNMAGGRLRGELLANNTYRPQSKIVLDDDRSRSYLLESFCLDYEKKPYLRTSYRRNVFLVSQLLRNLGARMTCPLLSRFGGEPRLHDFPLPKAWKGLVDREEKGEELGWHQSGFDDSAWKPIDVPGAFDRQVPGLADYDGVFWYRIRFHVPKGLATQGLKLHLGGIDDESWIWLNGKFLGEVTKATNPKDYWNFPRVYEMKPGMLKRGDQAGAENVLVVRCRDTYQTGGIMGTPRLSAKGPWLESYYVQEPKAVDDPYRYYRW